VLLPARLLTLLLAVAVGLSYGVPCLPDSESSAPEHARSDTSAGEHHLASPSHGASEKSMAHAHHPTQAVGSHHAPAADCEANVGAPCPCGCGQGSGPAGVSARPGPAVRISIASLPAAEEMTPFLASAPRLSPAPLLGIDHVPI
jgi:hypothetical protein